MLHRHRVLSRDECHPASTRWRAIVGDHLPGSTPGARHAVERALSFGTLNVPLIYDGPKKIEDIFNDSQFHSRLSVGINGKRVMRVRPQFRSWAMELEGIFVEDAGLNFDELENICHMAGIIEGIGDNRINGYGRFIGKVVRCG